MVVVGRAEVAAAVARDPPDPPLATWYKLEVTALCLGLTRLGFGDVAVPELPTPGAALDEMEE